MKTFDRTLLATLLIAGAVFALPALAETTTFKATLSGTEEVPQVTTKGTGSADITYDDKTKVLTWKGTYAGLSGAVTSSHFHGPAEAGKNAGVEVTVDAAASPFTGKAMLTDAQAADLMKGQLYLNLHTAANSSGEIRGQVLKAK